MGKIYQIVLTGLRGANMMIDVSSTEEQFKSTTVRQLKEKIAEKVPESAGEDGMRLLFTDKGLDEDCKLLSDYGVQDKSVILMVMKLPGGLTA